MRRRPIRFGLVGVLVTSVVITSGCWGESQAPEPQPRYELISEVVCEQLPVGEVAARFDLEATPGYQRTLRHDVDRGASWVMCNVDTTAVDERFATEIGKFDPYGVVNVTVYHEESLARDGYEHSARSFRNQTERKAGDSTSEITGWWDVGLLLEGVRPPDPDNRASGDSEIYGVVAARLIRHENLLIESYLHAEVPSADTTEVLTLLDDLVTALIDAAVEQLTLTE